MNVLASAGSAGAGAGATIAVIIGILAAIALYWLPTIVGSRRHAPNLSSITIINLFAGWTLIGWVVAFAMAVRDHPQPAYMVPPGWQPPAVPPQS